MTIRIVRFIITCILINSGFIVAYFVRYGLSIPENSFLPYKKTFLFLTFIYLFMLSLFGIFKSRFISSWELFCKTVTGLFWGTLFSVAFVYVFRVQWGAFPTSVFAISFLINLLLIFKINRYILKATDSIKKHVIILGDGKANEIADSRAVVERKRFDQISELLEYNDVDVIVVSERIVDVRDLDLLLFLSQKLKAEILFSPTIYMELMPKRINGDRSARIVSTFVGRQSDFDEFAIRLLDIISSCAMLVIAIPLMLFSALLIKIMSPGPIIYKQQRAGKDGQVFTLYKLRTMTADAEETSGFLPATENDPRITKIGKFLRKTRMDELPQLFNILRGEMSLVGPRPENLSRVGTHKALRGLRLVVKPGLTGLAQVYSFYDLHPNHKIKYDYLYIQRRSLLLNLYILAKTIPVVLLKKGT